MTEIKRVVRSKRKTLAIEINSKAEVIVRAPMRTSLKTIDRFIQGKKNWIVKSQNYQQQKYNKRVNREFVSGECLLFLGKNYILEISEQQKYPIVFKDNKFLLASQCQKSAKIILEKWYKKEAKKFIAERIKKVSKYIDCNYRECKINNATGRWGSCSEINNINFSWRLIMTPIEIIDYVIVHELVHTKIKNHSKRYWQAVAKIMPDYKKREKWLNDNHHLIYL